MRHRTVLARRMVPVLFASMLQWLPARADAYLAREPITRVLRAASPDLAACRERHALPEGRYLVRLVIDWTGKVTELELGASPEALSPAAESCIAAAFTHLRFASWEAPPPRALETVDGPERRARIPPDLRGSTRRSPGIVVIHWPFVLAP